MADATCEQYTVIFEFWTTITENPSNTAIYQYRGVISRYRASPVQAWRLINSVSYVTFCSNNETMHQYIVMAELLRFIKQQNMHVYLYVISQVIDHDYKMLPQQSIKHYQ